MRKILNGLWAVIAHAIVLIVAHSFAQHFGAELASLVKDEWMVTAIDYAMGK